MAGFHPAEPFPLAAIAALHRIRELYNREIQDLPNKGDVQNTYQGEFRGVLRLVGVSEIPHSHELLARAVKATERFLGHPEGVDLLAAAYEHIEAERKRYTRPNLHPYREGTMM